MEFIKNKNYIVVFTYGAFIQRHIKLSENLELMPLKPLYEQCLVNYLSTSCRDFNVKVEGENLKELYKQIKDTRPAIGIIITSDLDFDTPEDFENEMEDQIKKLKLIVSFISGDKIIEFGRIIKFDSETFFRMIPNFSRKRQKLFFSKEQEENFYDNAHKISTSNRYFMSLLHDANQETNPLFKLARYFGVLEAISNNYKQPGLGGSKDRIRFMIYNDKTKRNAIKTKSKGEDIELDPIEISYRFRNNFSHGGEPTYEKFNDLMPVEIWNLLSQNSNIIVNSLQSNCELQLMKELNK